MAFEFSVLSMDREEFRQALSEKTTPQTIYDNAPAIYQHLGVIFDEFVVDSLLREWAFEWASEKLSIPYDAIYDKWLEN